MNVVKCKNKHFFDKDSYEVCPHCGADVENAPIAKKAKKGLFGKKENTASATTDIGMQPRQTDNVSVHGVNAPQQVTTPTMDIWSSNSVQVNNPLPTVAEAGGSVQGGNNIAMYDGDLEPMSREYNETKNSDIAVASMENKPVEEPVVEQTVVEQQNDDLKEAIKAASANPEGKTVGFFSMQSAILNNASGANNTTSSSVSGGSSVTKSNEPCVGWLVCVQGPHFGQSFGLYSGRNSLGRYDSNDVVFSADGSISREKHAWIIFEPKKKKFFIKAGDGSGLTYLNDEMVETNVEIHRMDKIELGQTVVLFVPLCDEDFSWEDYI